MFFFSLENLSRLTFDVDVGSMYERDFNDKSRCQRMMNTSGMENSLDRITDRLQSAGFACKIKKKGSICKPTHIYMQHIPSWIQQLNKLLPLSALGALGTCFANEFPKRLVSVVNVHNMYMLCVRDANDDSNDECYGFHVSDLVRVESVHQQHCEEEKWEPKNSIQFSRLRHTGSAESCAYFAHVILMLHKFAHDFHHPFMQ